MDFLNSVWDLLLLVAGAFIFIAAIMVLFMVVSDLFRDHDLNGWFKALWIIALLFLPFLSRSAPPQWERRRRAR